MRDRCLAALIAASLASAGALARAETPDRPTTADRPDHQESAAAHQDEAEPELEAPPLPEGMTLEETLEYSARPPPTHFPDPVPDDQTYVFTFIEQFEYRMTDGDGPNHLGWEAQGWVGGDFNKFWWKNEGEAVFEDRDQGESETDLLYSRLVTPFWNIQAGVQYANEWNGDYDDRWSGVIALQGLAPYKFEVDVSLYVSEDGDVTSEFEGEYDLRITQRLVLQPRLSLGFAAGDIPERALGAGLTDVAFDLRLRYEIRREFAPYIGVRGSFLVGETEDLAEATGEDTGRWLLMAGVRFAF